MKLLARMPTKPNEDGTYGLPESMSVDDEGKILGSVPFMEARRMHLLEDVNVITLYEGESWEQAAKRSVHTPQPSYDEETP